MPISLEDAFDTLADDTRFEALIDGFAQKLGARSYAGGWSSAHSVEQIVAFKGFTPRQVEIYLSEYAHLDPWTLALLQDPVFGRFVDMTTYVDPESYSRSALYQNFFRPEDIDVFYAAAFMMMTEGVQSGLTFHRGRQDGPFEKRALAEVNKDAGDLARLFHLKVRMSKLAQKSGGWEDLLSRLDVEVYLTDRAGRLLECNDEAHTAISEEYGLTVASGRLCATDPQTKLSLDRVIAAAMENLLEATDTFVAGAGASKRRFVVLPLRQADGSLRLAFVGEAKKNLDPHFINTLRSSFGLSPIEAEVMVRLANGESARDISRSREVSEETTRTQYRSALRKMGCRSLTEAIIAVRRMPPVRT